MGTNYYFVPRKMNYDIFRNIHTEYQDKLDELVNTYIENVNNEYNRQIEDTNDLYRNYGLRHKDEWYTTPYLETVDYPEIHICKLSAGWKPILQANENYRDIESLRYFYENNKDNIKVMNEYDEDIKFEDLIKEIIDRTNNENNQTHLKYNGFISAYQSYYTDSYGVEWTYTEFS